jgi:hypothetical protein
MQQLTLQFEGFADDCRQPIGVTATTQRHEETAGFCNAMQKKLRPLVNLTGTLSRKLSLNLDESKKAKLLAPVLVCVAFGMMFFAAIIEG